MRPGRWPGVVVSGRAKRAALLGATWILAALVVLPRYGSATTAEALLDLPLVDGTTARVLYAHGPFTRATLVMLPGGSGELGLESDGSVRHGDDFLVRTRADWVARGYAVMIPDSARGANLRGLRSSPAVARIVDELVRFARARTSAPVFLLGTSQGTIAAVNGASRASPGLIAGVVLTEAVTTPGRLSVETVFDADPQEIRVPVLIVANRDDRCAVASPGMAGAVAAAMTRSPEVRVEHLDGGDQRSVRACGARSPHGYFGIERVVEDLIDRWASDVVARIRPQRTAAPP